MSDTERAVTYTLYGVGAYLDEAPIHTNITAFHTVNYYGGIAVYEVGNTDQAFPDAVYAPGQWSSIVKFKEGS